MNPEALRALACASVLLSLLAATVNSASAARSRAHLVPLKTGKPDPGWQTWVTGKRSRVLHTYDDTNDIWSVFVLYKGCPVTPRGAIRVTVYQNQYKWNSVGQGEWVADYSKPAVRYSRTVVDRRSSDNVLYTWPAHKRSSWEIHLQVPSPGGCTWWKYGGETNYLAGHGRPPVPPAPRPRLGNYLQPNYLLPLKPDPCVYSGRAGAEPPAVDAVYIGRPSPWGNPFSDGAKAENIARFAAYAADRAARDPQ